MFPKIPIYYFPLGFFAGIDPKTPKHKNIIPIDVSENPRPFNKKRPYPIKIQPNKIRISSISI